MSFIRLILLFSIFFISFRTIYPDDGLIQQIKGTIVEGLEGRFSGTFQSSPVAEVLKNIGSENGLNIMVSPKINQTVTAKFKDVPVKDAFLAILSANDLYYLEQGKIIKIITLPEYRNELLRNYVITKTYDASIIDIKNLSSVLKPLLSPGIGNFTVDAQSSKIVVMDIEENFPRIDTLLQNIAELPNMVEIETKVLEIDLEDGFQFGMDWSALSIYNYGDIKINLSGVQDSSIQAKGVYVDPAGNFTLNGLVEAVSKTTKGNVITQPRVLALNRNKASILIGNKVPYIKSMTLNDTTGKQTSQVDYIDTGVKMEVDPLISQQNEIMLSIKVQLSSYNDKAISETEKAPELITTEVSCSTTSRDGQIIIIGGLIKTTKSTITKKLPLLGDIPFLGYLFSKTEDNKKRQEIVIFLCPKVLKNGKSNFQIAETPKELLELSGFTNTKPVRTNENSFVSPELKTNTGKSLQEILTQGLNR